MKLAYVDLLSAAEPAFMRRMALGAEVFRGLTSLQESVDANQLPEFLRKQELTRPVPEVLFIGRSNVGKSSLLNALLGTDVAEISKRPGRTRKLHFHDIASRLVVVDAPGYGYRRFTKYLDWERLIKNYITKSERLRLVILLINSQHSLKQSDYDWMSFLSKQTRHVMPVLTKCDKVQALQATSTSLWHETRQCGGCLPYVLLTSSKSEFGLQELKAAIVDTVL